MVTKNRHMKSSIKTAGSGISYTLMMGACDGGACVGVSDGVGDDGLSGDEEFYKAVRQPRLAGLVTETVQCGTAWHRGPLSSPSTPVFPISWLVTLPVPGVGGGGEWQRQRASGCHTREAEGVGVGMKVKQVILPCSSLIGIILQAQSLFVYYFFSCCS